MRDLNELLEGNVDDVVAVVGTLSHEELVRLHGLETESKARKGVLTAIGAAMALTTPASAPEPGIDTPLPANIPPATEIDPAGAPIQILPDLDLTHPAVDNNPRANTSVDQNRIDFNDPHLDGREVVEAALAQQVEG